jgi:alkanesulfonate monooxygenase SsuD/methylene tetrahydromethanopterin reductase-like flavin-dependent oxidoreductase (luciferase family)
MTRNAPRFGWMMGAVGADGDSDAELYRQILSDAELGAELGYDAAWVVEHHFSDYYPTPNALTLLANIAARCPTLGLATAVIVTPWHHPLRIAEEIAMLTMMTDAPVRIGLGRGNAPLEYEAFGQEMGEAKDRFQECWEIIQLAMKGEPFSYKGRYLSVPREVRLRPTPRLDNLTFHGAIGAPSSALKIAELGLPPMLTGHTPLEQQKKVLASWTEAAMQHGMDPDAIKLASPILVMADTDEEAQELARRHVPRWYQLQVEHYAFDAERYADVPHYQSFAEMHKRRLVYCDPANIGPLIESSLIGSAATVRAKLERFFAVGYNYVLVVPSLPGLPHGLRQDWLTRFARDVMPHFAAGEVAAPARDRRTA